MTGAGAVVRFNIASGRIKSAKALADIRSYVEYWRRAKGTTPDTITISDKLHADLLDKARASYEKLEEKPPEGPALQYHDIAIVPQSEAAS